MKLPSFKLGGKNKEKVEKVKKPKKEKKGKAIQEVEEGASGEKPGKGSKKSKFKVKGFGFVLLVLIVAATAISGVAYGYIYFTGGLEKVDPVATVEGEPVPEKPKFSLASLIPKPKPKEIKIDEDLQKLIDMYELQNTQAGKIEELQEENTVLVEENEELTYRVEVYKTEVEKMEPGKSEVIEQLAKEKPKQPDPVVGPNGVSQTPKPPPTFDEPEGGWETNEKIAQKLSEGIVASVQSWNEKFGGWVCVGTDGKRYLIIPSGTAIEAVKLGL